MMASDKSQRDVKLMALLVERELDERGCDVPGLKKARRWLEPCRLDSGQIEHRLTFELQPRLPVMIESTWHPDAYRDLDHLCHQAEATADMIAALWRGREEAAGMLAGIASAIRREIAKARRRGLPYRLKSVAIATLEAGSTETPWARVEFEILGPSLLPTTVEIQFNDVADVKRCFEQMLEQQEARRDRKLRLKEDEADGEIDGVALEVMRALGCDVPAVLADLPGADGGVLDVRSPASDRRDIVLFWRDGVVHANMRLSEEVSLSDGKVWFRGENRLPAKPQGRLLSDFIQHEALPEGLRILSSYRSGENTYATVDERRARFNSRTGQAWPA